MQSTDHSAPREMNLSELTHVVGGAAEALEGFVLSESVTPVIGTEGFILSE